ncbi:hypothetical protein AAIR29_12230 [Psychrobacter sp. FBL11]|uniref:Uncharacterized protein n=1 Tax=Psychrobacter saeujeotis TaxID=3143436 RepID=A0ABU9XAF6_9GAMM|nr:hypothetical protein [uncultured Psychrobacter sp.]
MEYIIKARLIKSDLIEINSQFQNYSLKDMSSIILVKQALVSIANLVDFERTIRPIYHKHKALSAIFNKKYNEYEFAKYIRNKFIGHIKIDLLTKTIEWKPELRYLLHETNDPNVMFLYNIWVLETAINSFVDLDGKHKVFHSDTDLTYPPDCQRFLNFFTQTTQSAIEYLNNLDEILYAAINEDEKKESLEHWLLAGKTDFKFIKK